MEILNELSKYIIFIFFLWRHLSISSLSFHPVPPSSPFINHPSVANGHQLQKSFSPFLRILILNIFNLQLQSFTPNLQILRDLVSLIWGISHALVLHSTFLIPRKHLIWFFLQVEQLIWKICFGVIPCCLIFRIRCWILFRSWIFECWIYWFP